MSRFVCDVNFVFLMFILFYFRDLRVYLQTPSAKICFKIFMAYLMTRLTRFSKLANSQESLYEAFTLVFGLNAALFVERKLLNDLKIIFLKKVSLKLRKIEVYIHLWGSVVNCFLSLKDSFSSERRWRERTCGKC